MNKFIALLLTTLAIFFSSLTYAITLDELQHQFSKNEVIRANFTQNRYINGLSNPLHSTGKMILSQKWGLWWQQQTPFTMTLKMNNQRMEQRIDDQTPQIITAENQPQLFEFNHLLTAIFTADKQKLENNFMINLSEQEHQWTLILTPKLAPLNKIFKEIILTGHKHLNTITLNDMQHDKTVITFSKHQTANLTEHELSLFK
ncbi:MULTISPECIES: outer membrane lipoprotein carrier protein LolA [unclassified Gilliamella]|uniref:outer membrane lipoprotein carrier protein LolA n=1 Tax=unclassified Gilliamella TaxID=2685620 RepID=UPI002269D72C|nr:MULTISPECIES: outer membrane lipoprotein carrier protein LolA [unclassified Gilliamella]